MIDDEIIKEATEAVERNLDCGYAMPHLLNIINRQKAEIERLEEKVREKSTEIKSIISGMDRSTKEKREAIEIINCQKAEIKALIAGQETLQKYIAIAKSEAIKEFVEQIFQPYQGKRSLDRSDVKAIIEKLADYL